MGPVEKGVEKLEELADLIRGERRSVALLIDEGRRGVHDEGEPVHDGFEAGKLRDSAAAVSGGTTASCHRRRSVVWARQREVRDREALLTSSLQARVSTPYVTVSASEKGQWWTILDSR